MYENKLNGMKYIGSTTDLIERKKSHASSTRDDKFHVALREIGLNNFEFKILKEIQCKDEEDLWEMEELYCNRYDTLANGYNSKRVIKNL